MDLIIAILLWIGCISAPNTYSSRAIDDYATTHDPTITSVMGDSTQQSIIWQQYGAAVPYVEIIPLYE